MPCSSAHGNLPQAVRQPLTRSSIRSERCLRSELNSLRALWALTRFARIKQPFYAP